MASNDEGKHGGQNTSTGSTQTAKSGQSASSTQSGESNAGEDGVTEKHENGIKRFLHKINPMRLSRRDRRNRKTEERHNSKEALAPPGHTKRVSKSRESAGRPKQNHSGEKISDDVVSPEKTQAHDQKPEPTMHHQPTMAPTMFEPVNAPVRPAECHNSVRKHKKRHSRESVEDGKREKEKDIDDAPKADLQAKTMAATVFEPVHANVRPAECRKQSKRKHRKKSEPLEQPPIAKPEPELNAVKTERQDLCRAQMVVMPKPAESVMDVGQREQRSPKKEPEKKTKGKREASEEEKDAIPKDDDPPTAIQAVITKPPPPASVNPANYKIVYSANKGKQIPRFVPVAPWEAKVKAQTASDEAKPVQAPKPVTPTNEAVATSTAPTKDRQDSDLKPPPSSTYVPVVPQYYKR